ncbi:MAG: hypothetical protein C0478_10915 [Planctomyces sp.]|nr:hypothetical protein [Planctomyces sp.]
MYHGIAALLGRSLRLDARQIAPNLFRLGFVVALYFALLIAQVEAGSFGAPGLRFFQNIAWLNFLVILFSGVTYFSTAITEEKEEATLGLLRMAGISPLGVLLGKSTSRLISALILLAIQIPFTLLAITLGGATLDQILAAYVALGAFIILLANAGLLSSVICARGGTAAALTCFWVGIYFTLPLLAMYVSSEIRSAGGPTPGLATWTVATTDYLAQSSIATELSKIVTSGYGDFSDVIPVDEDGLPLSSWNWAVWQARLNMLATPQVISNVLGGLFLFGISWLLFDRLTRYERPGLVAERNIFMPLKIGKSQRSPVGQAWANPFIWKDFYFIAGGPRWLILRQVLVWIVAFLLHLWFALTNTPRGDLGIFELGQFFGIALGIFIFMIIVEAAIYSSRIFQTELQNQTLSALLMLPRSIGFICYSKGLGCALGLVPTLVSIFLAWLGLVMCAAHPDEMLRDTFEVLTQPGVWGFLTLVVVFVNLVATFSLFLKWGSLPLSFVIMFFGSSCCPVTYVMMAFSGVRNDPFAAFAGIMINIMAMVLISLVFHAVIASRLHVLGSKL